MCRSASGVQPVFPTAPYSRWGRWEIGERLLVELQTWDYRTSQRTRVAAPHFTGDALVAVVDDIIDSPLSTPSGVPVGYDPASYEMPVVPRACVGPCYNIYTAVIDEICAAEKTSGTHICAGCGVLAQVRHA